MTRECLIFLRWQGILICVNPALKPVLFPQLCCFLWLPPHCKRRSMKERLSSSPTSGRSLTGTHLRLNCSWHFLETIVHAVVVVYLKAIPPRSQSNLGKHGLEAPGQVLAILSQSQSFLAPLCLANQCKALPWLCNWSRAGTWPNMAQSDKEEGLLC